jgi:hypothetical protein
MRKSAGLSDAEVRDVADFLTRYSVSRFAREKALRGGDPTNTP